MAKNGEERVVTVAWCMVDRVPLWDRTEVSPEDDALGIGAGHLPRPSPRRVVRLDQIREAFASAPSTTITTARSASPVRPTCTITLLRWQSIIADLRVSTTSRSPRRLAARHRGGHRRSGLDEIEDQFGSEVATHRRRRHQTRPDGQVRHQGGPAGGLHAEDDGGGGQGPACPYHQVRRSPAQPAHASPFTPRSGSSNASPRETLDIYAPLGAPPRVCRT